MLLTITSTQPPATDLGYLLHKNPARLQTFELSFGQAHVFYTEASAERCTAALLLDVDPVGLVRNRRGPSGDGGALDQYVNDRPYVASSFMSVAIARIFGSALGGRSEQRPELAAQPLPLTASVAVVASRGGEEFLRRLFEPLGYSLTAQRHPLDEKFPDWGEGIYYSFQLAGTTRLQDLLAHLYVLLPVLDAEKHYWVGEAEVEKLLRHGEGWLPSHPERDAIVHRYLRYQKRLAREALARLVEDDQPDPDAAEATHATEEQKLEEPLRLWQQRIQTVVAALKGRDVKRVIDVGCGEGKLLQALMKEKEFEQVTGMDVAWRSLEIAGERLNLERLPPKQRERIQLFHGSLMYRDSRLSGYDAATVIEVIEHLDAPRLAAFERVLFQHAHPGMVVLTTPNAEYNVRWETLPAGRMRHKDHRFEWTRAQFQEWASEVAARYGYAVEFSAVGAEDAEVGAPTQMGVFTA